MYPYQTQFQSIKLLCIFKTLGDSPLVFFDLLPFVTFVVPWDFFFGTLGGRCFPILTSGMINVSSLAKFWLLWYSHASNTYFRTKLTLIGCSRIPYQVSHRVSAIFVLLRRQRHQYSHKHGVSHRNHSCIARICETHIQICMSVDLLKERNMRVRLYYIGIGHTAVRQNRFTPTK